MLLRLNLSVYDKECYEKFCCFSIDTVLKGNN